GQVAHESATRRLATRPALGPAALQAPRLVLRRRLGLVAQGIADARMRAGLERLRDKVERTLARLDHARPDAVRSLQRLQAELQRDFADRPDWFKKSLDPTPVPVGDAPHDLPARYVGRSGRYLLRIHPGVDIWQEAGARRFIEDLRTVDPDVTGPTVTNFEATHLIERGYFEGTPYALVLVAVTALAILRTVRGT